jgi:hypothetical protein
MTWRQGKVGGRNGKKKSAAAGQKSEFNHGCTRMDTDAEFCSKPETVRRGEIPALGTVSVFIRVHPWLKLLPRCAAN